MIVDTLTGKTFNSIKEIPKGDLLDYYSASSRYKFLDADKITDFAECWPEDATLEDVYKGRAFTFIPLPTQNGDIPFRRDFVSNPDLSAVSKEVLMAIAIREIPDFKTGIWSTTKNLKEYAHELSGIKVSDVRKAIPNLIETGILKQENGVNSFDLNRVVVMPLFVEWAYIYITHYIDKDSPEYEYFYPLLEIARYKNFKEHD